MSFIACWKLQNLMDQVGMYHWHVNDALALKVTHRWNGQGRRASYSCTFHASKEKAEM